MGTFETIISHLCMTLFGVILLICVVKSQSICTPKEGSNCVCEFDDGTKIDLTPLASSSGPAFDFKLPNDGQGDYLYAYNPCTGFTSGACVNVAACQKSRDGKYLYNIGNPDTAEFNSDGSMIKYKGPDPKITDVDLVCDKSFTKPKYEVIGETSTGSNEYKLRLTTCHACREGCPKSSKKGLSFGSILCILFTVLLFVYLVGGMIFNRYVRGASGKEVIPNVSLWEEFPLLVKDGFVFVASCCKSDTSYESI